MRKTLLVVLLVVMVLMLSACVPGDGTSDSENPAGFLWGVWHGLIALITLIWGIFDSSVHIYEKFNTGWWYDLGFFIAITAICRGTCGHKRPGKRHGE
jgi:hypothetical protein